MYELHKRLTSSTEHLAFIAVHQVTKNSPIHTKNNLGITAMVEEVVKVLVNTCLLLQA